MPQSVIYANCPYKYTSLLYAPYVRVWPYIGYCSVTAGDANIKVAERCDRDANILAKLTGKISGKRVDLQMDRLNNNQVQVCSMMNALKMYRPTAEMSFPGNHKDL